LPWSVLLCWKDPQMMPTHHTFIPRRRHMTPVTRLCLDLYCCVGRIHKWCQCTIHLFSWQIKSISIFILCMHDSMAFAKMSFWSNDNKQVDFLVCSCTPILSQWHPTTPVHVWPRCVPKCHFDPRITNKWIF
jgi:hypothetical protein